jgi:enoyl-CoA hydratase
VFPADELIAEALKIAERLANLSPVAVALAKQAVNRAFETTLVEGVRHERALFLSLFGTPDQREGMAAFAEKRKPAFRLGG